MELEPADLTRCQCVITPAHGAFRLGPRPRPERCTNEPTYIAKEIAPGEDGLMGEMSLCEGCAEEMLTKPEIAARVQLVPIAKE